MVDPKMSYPYLQSFRSATPYPGSLRSAHRWPQTSNRASSQVVLATVGRSMWPCWIS